MFDFQESEIYQKCVRPPPNRTVFDSESPPPYRSQSALLDAPDRIVRCHSAGSSLLRVFRKFPSPGSSTPAVVVPPPPRRPTLSSYSESSSNLSNLSSLTMVPCETDESQQQEQQQEQKQRVWSEARPRRRALEVTQQTSPTTSNSSEFLEVDGRRRISWKRRRAIPKIVAGQREEKTEERVDDTRHKDAAVASDTASKVVVLVLPSSRILHPSRIPQDWLAGETFVRVRPADEYVYHVVTTVVDRLRGESRRQIKNATTWERRREDEEKNFIQRSSSCNILLVPPPQL